MVRRAILIVAFVTAVLPAAPAAALSCTVTEIVAGLCSVGGSTDGTGVDVWVDGDTAGGSSSGGNGPDCNETADGRCVGVSPRTNVDKPESVHDLESFRPLRPRQFSEPNGWTIAGLHTNFVSRAKTHIVAGELAGHSAEVRFTPFLYHRSFGDGFSQTTSHKGSHWTSAWANTTTDHAYYRAGTYTVHLVVDFLAEYRFGDMDWVRLDGVVSRSATDIAVRVFDANTVLVARQCAGTSSTCP
ncbi:MAG: hypothetical protein RLZ72_731 [Actinomycetota bacterium]